MYLYSIIKADVRKWAQSLNEGFLHNDCHADVNIYRKQGSIYIITIELSYVELSTGFTEKKIVSFIGGPMFCLKHQQILKGQVGDNKDVLLISAAQNEWSFKIFTQTIIEYF